MTRWKINGKECTLEELAGVIRQEMARPIGIIVVGVGPEVGPEVEGGDFKSRTVEKLRAGLQGMVQSHFLGIPSLVNLVRLMERPPNKDT